MLKDLFLKGKIKAKMKNLQKAGSSESGRTMTEMLGVLVIMGILSLGGIAGYRYGMNKHKANETIAELSLYAVDISTQMINNEGADVQLSNLPLETRMGYPLSAYLGDMDGYFELEVSDIPVGVCEQILRSGWQVPTAILVNGSFVNETEDIIDGTVSIDDACNQTENTLAFEFYKTLTPCEGAACGSGETGGSDGGSEDPESPNDWLDTPSCEAGFFWDWEQEQCVLETCPEGQFTTGSGCATCPTEGEIVKMSNSDVSDACTKCANGFITYGDNISEYQCIYCPASRTPCGDYCCNEGEVCQENVINSWSHYFSCVQPSCTSDSDCTSDPTKPVCDTYSGTCVACRSYQDCGPNQFCDGIGYNECTGTNYQKTECRNIGSVNELEGLEWSVVNNRGSTWYSAKDLCASIGKQLPSRSDLLEKKDILKETEFREVDTGDRAGTCEAFVYYPQSGAIDKSMMYSTGSYPTLCR